MYGIKWTLKEIKKFKDKWDLKLPITDFRKLIKNIHCYSKKIKQGIILWFECNSFKNILILYNPKFNLIIFEIINV